MSIQWRLIGDSALRFRFWDDEAVVYNSLSGDTHVLDAASAQLLLALQEAPADVQSLAQVLSEKWRCEPSEDLVGEIEMALSDMHALSLIEQG